MDRTDRLRQDDAENPLRAHLFGSKIEPLSGMAHALRQNGLRVTSTAEATDSAAGSRSSFRLPRETSFLLHHTATPRHHPLRIAAEKRQIPQRTPADLMMVAMQNRIGIVVAGGRLAGISAAMIAWILMRSGKDPSVLLDKPARQLGGCTRLGSGAHFVAEWPGDLTDLARIKPCLTLFLDLGLDDEIDGLESAGITETEMSRFRHELESGLVLAFGHPANLVGGSLLQPSTDHDLSRPVETFSFRRGSSWWGTDLRDESAGPRFRVFHKGDFVVEVRLQILGPRNIMSALAAVSACRALGLSPLEIGEGLEEFEGTSHDFELRGSYRGVTLAKDPAQKPGAIRETLNLARQTFQGRRLWVAVDAADLDLEPQGLQIPAFHDAFRKADRLVLIDGRESNREVRFDGLESPLLKILNTESPKAVGVRNVDEAIAELDRNLDPGDVLLTLGTGEVGTISDAFIRRLPKDRQGR